MALGEGGARDFLLGDVQGIPIEQQQTTPPEVSPMMEGLRATSGKTTDYYQAFGNLDAFAKNMWMNHKIDVTRADYSNPMSIKAHDLYLKASSYVNELGNKLSREATQEDIAMRQQVSDPDFYSGQLAGEDIDVSQYTHLGETDRIRVANQQFSGVYADPRVVAESNVELQKTRDQIQSEIDATDDPTLKLKLQREKASIGLARLDRNQILNRADRGQAKVVEATIRPLEFESAQGGNLESISSIADSSGDPLFMGKNGDIEPVWNPIMGKIFYANKKNDTGEIDLRSSDGGNRKMIGMFNAGTNTKMSLSELYNLNPRLRAIGSGREKAIEDFDKKYYDVRGEFIADLRNKEDNRPRYEEAKNRIMSVHEESGLMIVPGTTSDDGEVARIGDMTSDLNVSKHGGVAKLAAGIMGKSLEGIISMEFSYPKDDGSTGTSEITYNLNTKKGLSDFEDFVDYNAQALGYVDNSWNYIGGEVRPVDGVTAPAQGPGTIPMWQ